MKSLNSFILNSHFSHIEQDSYQNSLKYYRDMNNVVNTSRQEGIEEGRELGQRSLVFRLLNRRVGEISERLSDRIQALPIAQLETLAEDLLDFNGSDDLTDWLNKNE